MAKWSKPITIDTSQRPTFRHILERLKDIKTQSDLESLKDEVQGYLPLDQFEEDFDVQFAIENIKRDYISRAISNSKTLYEAADLLGLKSYQVLVNWMKRLDIKNG